LNIEDADGKIKARENRLENTNRNLGGRKEILVTLLPFLTKNITPWSITTFGTVTFNFVAADPAALVN
jgi:hypothetical protein